MYTEVDESLLEEGLRLIYKACNEDPVQFAGELAYALLSSTVYGSENETEYTVKGLDGMKYTVNVKGEKHEQQDT